MSQSLDTLPEFQPPLQGLVLAVNGLEPQHNAINGELASFDSSFVGRAVVRKSVLQLPSQVSRYPAPEVHCAAMTMSRFFKATPGQTNNVMYRLI